MTPQPWMTTYPTVAAVQVASLDTLCAWDEHLPAPQTDVERTVQRRITQALSKGIKAAAPEIGAKIDEIETLLKKAGIDLGETNIFSAKDRP